MAPPFSPGPQTNWKASERFPFVWLQRRRRSRDTVKILVFVGGPLLETIVPYGKFAVKKPNNQRVNCQTTTTGSVGSQISSTHGDHTSSLSSDWVFWRMRCLPLVSVWFGVCLRNAESEKGCQWEDCIPFLTTLFSAVNWLNPNDQQCSQNAVSSSNPNNEGWK